jgi:hypothetical protein
VDDDRFDTLTRALTSAASRRDLLARLTPGLLATLPLALGNDDAVAKPCPPCRKRKKGKCGKKRSDGTPCGNGGGCRDGRCDPNVCTLDCPGQLEPQPCGPAGSACQCVRVRYGDDVGTCVRPPQGSQCDLGESGTCEAGEVCGISCEGYLPFCWELCV